MSVAKAKAKTANANGVLRLEEGNDPLDTLLKQSIGKDPLFSLSRAGERPGQWIQYLQSFDQRAAFAELPGWPLLSPVKVQMQKCDKCRREFFSPINCRRHIRVHHRLKILAKDTAKSRDLLGSFWNELSTEDAKEILSLKDATLEGVPGEKIITNLASTIQKPGASALPKTCVRAGSALLDLIQARNISFPLSAQELFSILDDASENTFLCGPAMSMQMYIFDGDAGKIGLETKNLVAFTSFLLEQKLVKAWIADKDAEAFRMQELLMEEEEVRRRKKAELLERKRRKKLRQKAKEHKLEEKCHLDENSDFLMTDTPPEGSGHLNAPDSVKPLDALEDEADPFGENMDASEGGDSEAHSGFGCDSIDSGTSEGNKQPPIQGLSGDQRSGIIKPQMPQRAHALSRGAHAVQQSQMSKLEVKQKCYTLKEARAASTVNSSRMWNWKLKTESNEESGNRQSDSNKQEVLIGSISVTIDGGNNLQLHDFSGPDAEDLKEYGAHKKKIHEKHGKGDNVQCTMSRPTVKCWRPVSRNGIKGPEPVQSGPEPEQDDDCPSGSSIRSSIQNVDYDKSINCSMLAEVEKSRPLQFSGHAAKAFLAQRWKEAMTGDHVKLVLYPQSETAELQEDCQEVTDHNKRIILHDGEDCIANEGASESFGGAAGNASFGAKPGGGCKKRYVPKTRIGT